MQTRWEWPPARHEIGCLRGAKQFAIQLRLEWRFVFVAEQDRAANDEAPLKQVTFEINNLNSPEAEAAVCAGIEGLNGVRAVQFLGGGVVVTYNPLGISKEEICTEIRRGGYRATEIGIEQ